MSDQTLMARAINHLNQNPGTYTSASLARVLGCSKSSASRYLSMYQGMNPAKCVHDDRHTYIVTAVEVPEEAKIPAPTQAPRIGDWRQMEPEEAEDVLGLFDRAYEEGRTRHTEPPSFRPPTYGDTEYGPPFKVTIQRSYRSKRTGERWYQAKDEHGRWLLFKWEDDDLA